MTEQTTPIRPFDAYPAYLKEREDNQVLKEQLDAAITLLSLECGRRESRGEDVSHIRGFIKRVQP